jgi:hypothetical protein
VVVGRHDAFRLRQGFKAMGRKSKRYGRDHGWHTFGISSATPRRWSMTLTSIIVKIRWPQSNRKISSANSLRHPPQGRRAGRRATAIAAYGVHGW